MKLIFLRNNFFIAVILLTVILTSCSSSNILSDSNSWFMKDINGLGDFLKVYFVIQISIIITGLILSIFIGRLGYIISYIVNLIYVIIERDYGFFKVLLLFGASIIINIVFSSITQSLKEKK